VHLHVDGYLHNPKRQPCQTDRNTILFDSKDMYDLIMQENLKL
jgi:hypothetical protein